MKVIVLTILAMLLGAQSLFAQHGDAKLLVQSPDGKTVKLLWFIKKWDNNITGFDIKRKEGLQGWVKLNSEPILPGISATKKLSIVESDRIEESRIKAKLYRLVNTHKLQTTDKGNYLNKLSNDDKAVQDISNLIANDYDVALISGFGYVDHSVTKKINYQYGLFIQGTDVLLDVVAWNYGEVPDLNVVREITSRSTTGKNGIQVIWNADTAKVKAGNVAGFNIYREGIRLNSVPVVAANSKDSSAFIWLDNTANSAVQNQYSISAESLFGIEGIIKSYEYNPADHPSEYKKTEVTEVTSLGYYFKDGTSVIWTFPKDFERFIKGFYVEKNNMPDGFRRVSSLLNPSVRTFTDTSSSQVSGYIRMRVVAAYNDKTMVTGTERIYNYFPVRQPPPPQNVKVKTSQSDKKFTVSLSWDPPIIGDTMTGYYKVYASDPANGKLATVTENKPLHKESYSSVTEDTATGYYIVYASDPANGKLFPVTENTPLHKNNYSFVIDHGSACMYSFCVSAISKNTNESSFSDTVTVVMPSLDIPMPAINKVFADSNKVVIQWNYPLIMDVKGFRVFQNNHVIATENELNKNARQFTTQKLEQGTTYEFTMQAVTETNVVSNVSMPKTIIIPGADK